MKLLSQLKTGHNIARRYFVVNGFDGALTMLGIIVGFYAGNSTSYTVVINACLGAAVALGISGLTSAYISEQAERKKELRDLEQAMIQDLSESRHKKLSQRIPVFVAIVNGASPFIISLFILSPIFFSDHLINAAIDPLELSIAIAFSLLFLLGVFLGKISHTFWLWSGVRTLLIALATTALIFFVTTD